MARNSAVFLDRDGTIIEDRGYIKDPSEIVLFPESISALGKLQEFFLLFIITNQSGISKGITTEKEVESVNKALLTSLSSRGIEIKEVFCCPHTTEDNCICKKPSPYFVNRANDLYNLNLPGSFIIGDHPSDIDCGLNAGITPLFVLTGHGKKHLDEVQTGIEIFENIGSAAEFVINSKKI